MDLFKPKPDKIVTKHSILKQISKETTLEEVKELKLSAKLKKACKGAWTNGCGLAAIQIGIPLRYAWYKYNKKDYFLINPKILELKDPIPPSDEGCLSIPHKWTKVPRYNQITYISCFWV